VEPVDPPTPVIIPEQSVLPPPTISPQARQALSAGAAFAGLGWPPADDLDAWRRFIDAVTQTRRPAFARMLETAQAIAEDQDLGGVRCFDCRPKEGGYAGQSEGGPVYLYMHGGAFVTGGGLAAKAQGARAAQMLQVRCVSVDYRMPPDHPFPAAPADCVAAYRALLEQGIPPTQIVIGGTSAGGNLAAACVLICRDQGVPLPAGVVMMTPEVDLTESGDTFRTNRMLDVVLKQGLPNANRLYAGGADLGDPYVSPLFADFTRGFVPALIQSGTRDLFLSNSVLIHRKLREAGVEAELHVWEAMPHGGFPPGDAPENAEIQAEVARFIARVTT